MKTKNLFYFVCLLLTSHHVSATQLKVVNDPVYHSTNNDILLIEKIEITESATILYTNIYQRPNYWVSISSSSYLKGNSGKKYKILNSDNFELDQQIYISESGMISAILRFEPLDHAETSFDFIEGEEAGDFRISGIQLTPRILTGRFQCLIKGEVINRPYSNLLYLMKKGGDARIDKILIPIREGKFEYLMDIDDEEAYQLVFKDEHQAGGWRPISFFSYPGEIEMKLYPMEESVNNSIKGGFHNEEMVAYENQISAFREKCYEQAGYILNNLSSDTYTFNIEDYQRELMSLMKKPPADVPEIDLMAEYKKIWEEDRYLNEEAKEYLKKGEDAETDDEKHAWFRKFYDLQESYQHRTPEAVAVEEKMNRISSVIGDLELIYMNQYPSLVSYERLLEAMKLSLSSFPIYAGAHGKTGDYILLYNSIYSKKYPDHPYTREMQQIIETWSAIKTGGKYIDFTAPDKEGNLFTLSKLIDGQIALLDLWASWCGPCRRHSISMIPVYEEFKEKGFTVIGIARETDPQIGIHAMEKDGYPWLNLLEIKDKGEIWKKYGIGNAGGSSFLIDKDGTILAIHPSAEELRIILESKLKE